MPTQILDNPTITPENATAEMADATNGVATD